MSQQKNSKRISLLSIISGIILLLGMTTAFAGAELVIDDLAVSDAVEDELKIDAAVPAYRIDINTNEGIVTLSGSVDNILAKERATSITETVKGVRAVINKIEVTPSVLRTDQEIREDVKDALLLDSATETYDVQVTVDNNKVTLSGGVDSWQEKRLAEKVAKGVNGVKEITNNIVVAYEVDRSDFEIKKDIEQALRWDTLVDHALINIVVDDGNVYLTGTVGSAAEKSRAIDDSWVAGVTSVNITELEVEYWARDEALRKGKYVVKSDEEIREAVQDALHYDPRVSTFQVTPMVSAGAVTLRGSVNNLKAARAAAQDARNTVGVRKVDNRIKVRPKAAVSDQKIEERLRRALRRNPYVDKHEISVEVINGVANLDGIVDTYFQKAQADDVASRINGVIMVDNSLVVQEDYAPYLYEPYAGEDYVYELPWHEYRPRFPSESDIRIKEDIKDELFWSPFVDDEDVNVTVDNGEATLTGNVDSWSEYNAAANNAYEGGAVYVDNDLVVK